MALAPEIQAELQRMAATGTPPLEEQSVEQARRLHVAGAAALAGAPVAAAAGGEQQHRRDQ